MFRSLLAHPLEALHKRHWVYCVRVMSVGCTRIGVELLRLLISVVGSEIENRFHITFS
jgi:hypothetical protein